ncbi:YdcF family protein [Enterococcus saccharolyticus]|uniref:DUF218 domain-containing protein n=1 Tax=Candidatus Enterococcus willemsii TaxID=1857215 RepID=A0ABQ6YZX7_9ENTE|nr:MULTISPECIES: YdcF family protein [Enterococcus]KAF1303485.1 hypothetical protein BAU17_12305 [Enterococcus sp. CU12B]MCD5002672.1 YdcF family protein [Enterococcus saccharolyticus]
MDIKQLFIFFIPYLLGAWGIITWRKRQAVPDIFFFLCSWTLLSLSVYLGIIESQHGSFFWVVPVGFFTLFFFSFQQAKAKLINGFLFNLFIAVFGAYLLFNFILTQNIVILLLLIGVGLIFLFLALFGFVGLMILLYWNAVVVIKRESHSLANLLTLIAAILMTLWLIYDFTFAGKLPEWASTLLAILPMGLIYFGFVFFNFLTISVLYQFNHPRYNQDFIIVLGAGLIDGERVTPLLAQRIDRAIRFYRQQENKTTPPKFIMSGGQGPDEKIPEAVAMKNYALTQGIPEEDILVESNSTTTLENMKFSKEIIQQTNGKKANVIFSSNNYHIFRAGIFARWAGLNADGIGSKTALYYLPNAFLREFIAIVAMNKKRHFLIVGILASLLLFLTLITWLVPLFVG